MSGWRGVAAGSMVAALAAAGIGLATTSEAEPTVDRIELPAPSPGEDDRSDRDDRQDRGTERDDVRRDDGPGAARDGDGNPDDDGDDDSWDRGDDGRDDRSREGRDDDEDDRSHDRSGDSRDGTRDDDGPEDD